MVVVAVVEWEKRGKRKTEQQPTLFSLISSVVLQYVFSEMRQKKISGLG